ncbi:peptidoglycan-binding domain-containing protein [Streptomyces sp. NPDC006638]|uniref:peptidoglycan-binding domain-containing protein n=1 Tax=Streptomyces sp. NPDC006638 TaxID=3157183 RepID=UPI0033B41198
MTQESCPRCFAPPGEAGHPDCACATRADIAGKSLTDPVEQSGDGDQMHVRPYVSLGSGTDAPEGKAEPTAAEKAERERAARERAAFGPPGSAGAETTAVQGVVVGATAHDDGKNDSGNNSDEDDEEGRAGVTAAGAGAGAAEGSLGDDDTDEPPARRRKGLYLAVAIAVVAAVIAVSAGVALRGGGEDEAAGPGSSSSTARTALPDATGTAGDKAAPAPDRPASDDAASSPSDDPSASPSDTAPASASASATSAKGQAGEDTPASPTASASPTGSASPGSTPSPGPAVLREGDTGPEVVELQKRMSQLLLRYLGRPDGTYDAELERAVARYQKDRDITGDASGVYGPATRKVLEAETEKP